jgi:cell division protein FtsZ
MREKINIIRVGEMTALESKDEIHATLDGADMVFLVADMSYVTGAATFPVIANIAKERGALVVAVVTRPFSFEGRKRLSNSEEGIKKIQEQVDAIIVIPSPGVLSVSDKRTTMNSAYENADNILGQVVQSVIDLLHRPGIVNVDFDDLRAIMSNAGRMVIGIGEGRGENSIVTATHNALNSPVIEHPITGAKRVLVNVTSGSNIQFGELSEAMLIINNASDENANVIWGQVFNPDMEDMVRVTIMAAEFD